MPIKTSLSTVYDRVHDFTFEMLVSCSLAPTFHLVSYYLAGDSIAVWDTTKFMVQSCFSHKVVPVTSLETTENRYD